MKPCKGLGGIPGVGRTAGRLAAASCAILGSFIDSRITEALPLFKLTKSPNANFRNLRIVATPIDIANRQQVYLERLKAGFDRDWRSVQAELRKRTREVLAALDVENLQDLSRRQLQSALIQLRQAQVYVTGPAMSEFLDKQMPDLAALSASMEERGLISTIANPPKFNMPTAKLAFDAALANPVQATGQLLEELVKGWPAQDALRVSNLVRTGWAQGTSLQDMIRQATGTKAAGYADGFLDVSRKNAGTVIHTATQHVANAARMEVWERNGDIVQKYQWLSTLDRRTTQQCKSLDGRTFDPGKGPMPPIHPNCRSTTVAVLGKEFDFLDAGATRASGGPDAGYVNADLNYYDWLKKQPKDFQERAIGPVRTKLFREGGLTPDRFAELNLGRNFEPLTLAEMRQIEPEAFKRAGL
jgi:SPP1 gp7 family putative phage head morphogenesis protein